MGQQHQPTLWIRPTDRSSAGCADCMPTTSGPACRGRLGGQTCMNPEFRGAEAPLQRVIESLRAVVDPEVGDNILDLHLVKSLRIEDGEAELTVTFPRGCGNASQITEDAFQAMRRLLPDTDIYVRHAA